MSIKYILDKKGEPVVEPDLMKWAKWFETEADPLVAREHIHDSTISTVFLGLDYNLGGHGPPLLWETMVFGGPLSQEKDRCSGSRAQAKEMHDRMVKKVKEL